MPRTSWRHMLLVLSLLGLARATYPTGLRQRTCLNRAVYNYTNRTNVKFEGAIEPLKIIQFSWASGKIDALMFKIIVEEVLGVHAIMGSSYGSAIHGFRAMSCINPLSKVVPGSQYDFGCCEDIGSLHGHVVIETWAGALPTAMAYLNKECPDKKPIHKGTMGKKGMEPIFVTSLSTVPAKQQYHLPLEYYVSYSNPEIDIRNYFSDPWDIPDDDIALCSATRLHTDQGMIEAYRKYLGSKDPTGTVYTGTNSRGEAQYQFDCSGAGNGRWWLSPKCRENTSRCIPYFTGGTGWMLNDIVQKATAWDMAVAVGVAASWGKYTVIPKQQKGIFYWWWPDVLFTAEQPTRIVFPVSNKVERAEGNMQSASKDVDLEKWAVAGVVNRTNEGFQRLLGVLERITFSPQQYQLILDRYLALGGTADVMEQVVCEWLNQNEHVWYSGDNKWLPEETSCLEGQGLQSLSGQWVDTTALAASCQWCDPGRYSERIVSELTYKCTACSAGTYQTMKGETECSACDLGEAAQQPEQKSCTPCPKGYYADALGTVNCTICQSGFITPFTRSQSASDCVCPEGQFRDEVLRSQCNSCPPGMTCPEGADAQNFGSFDPKDVTPLLDVGMWSNLQSPLSIFRCEGTKRCPGRRRPGNPCAKGLIQTLQGCAHCEDGYVWSGDGCLPCGSPQITTILFPVVPIVLCPIVILVLYKMFGDGYAKWGTWNNGIAAAGFIVLNHAQIVNIVKSSNLAWPHNVAKTLETFQYTSDVATIFRPDCAGFGDFQSMLILRALIPVFLALMYIFVWGMSQLIGKKFPICKMEPNRTLNGFFSLIFTFFAGITEMAFTIFKCTDNPNGTSSLKMDRSITCYEDKWNGMLIIGILAVVFWVVGFGMLFIRSIITAPSFFHDKNLQMRWKFLFIRYRADVHWWAVVFVLKGITLNLASVIFKVGVMQVLWISICLTIYESLVALYRPWRHMPNNNLDYWAHVTLIMGASLATWYGVLAVNDKPAADGTMNMLLTIFIFSCWMPVPIMIYLLLVPASRRAKEEKERVTELIIDAFSLIMGADKDEREQFLQHLNEWDFWFMLKAKNILQMTFAKRRCRGGYSIHNLDEVQVHMYSNRNTRRSMARISNSGKSKNITAVRF